MAATLTVSAPTTSAVTTAKVFETDGYDEVVLSAPGLATTEEVDIFVRTPGGDAIWAGTGGAAVTLTAAKQSVVLPGGPKYAIKKDATAASVGVYATMCKR